jgi:hypothetical protein
MKFHHLAFRIILIILSFALSNPIELLATITLDTSLVKRQLVFDLETLDLRNGDMVFFQSKTFNGTMTQIGTRSPFTHSSMVVVLDDGTIALTHATDNDYHGFKIPLIYEDIRRNGVILTRLDDLFLSTDKGQSGYYKSIWIRRMDETKINRPTSKDIMDFYIANKHHPFEPSTWQFILTAFDISINGRDIFHAKMDDKIMCSEYICLMIKDLGLPIFPNEAPNETSPKDLYDLLEGYYLEPVVYRFDGKSYKRTAS